MLLQVNNLYELNDVYNIFNTLIDVINFCITAINCTVYMMYLMQYSSEM